MALVAALVLVGCSGDSEADAGSGSPAAVATVTTNAPGVVLGAIVSEVDVETGDPVTDMMGNEITVHGWTPWPTGLDVFDPYANPDLALFGNIAFNRSPGTSMVAIDIEACASADQPADKELFGARFQPITNDGEVVGGDDLDLRSFMIFQPVLTPYFEWPAAGECSRGWQGLEWAIDLTPPSGAQYTAISTDDDTFGQRHVYRWAIGDPVAAANLDGAPSLVEGLSGSFIGGELSGATVTVNGWLEVDAPDSPISPSGRPYLTALSGSRLIAALIETCAGTSGSMPTFGLQVDGWNLLGEFRRDGPWSLGFTPLVRPVSGDCATGWVAFEVPDGATPTAVFATDPFDLDAQWFFWRLGTEQIDAPTLVAGFPDEFLMTSVQELCGVTDSLALDVASEALGLGATYEPVTSIAISNTTSSSRLSIYLSEQPLEASDIPHPLDADTRAIQIVIENTSSSALAPGTFRRDVTSELYGDAAFVVGATNGATSPFASPEIEITAINDDYVCGTISAVADGTGGNGVQGRFGAPIWQPGN